MIKRLRAALAAWADVHLVADWRRWWKLWSVQLGLALGALVALFGDPQTWVSIAQDLYSIPPEYRWFVPRIVGFAIGFAPTILRLWNQAKPKGQCGG